MNASAAGERILAIAFGFRSSRVLLSAVELGLFDALADGPLDATHLAAAAGLHSRGATDFFDALVALELLSRDAAGRYSNVAEAAEYLESRGSTSLVGLLEYLGTLQYGSWDGLTESLRQGQAQRALGPSMGFGRLYEDDASFNRFMSAMSAGIVLPATALAERFPWASYRSFADIGSAEGRMAAEIAGHHEHLTGIGFDLPKVGPSFAVHMQARGVADRVMFEAGDFFVDPLPKADVVILARILHDWDIPTRRRLLEKSFDAVPPGGAVIVCEQLLDKRRSHAHALLASLNMLLQTTAGSESTTSQCSDWMHAARFRETQLIPLVAGYVALVAIK